MATMTLDHYTDVQRFITSILKGNNQYPVHLPHKNFWEAMTYAEFVTGNVPGIQDPDTNAPMPVLIKGNSAQSNLILALQGAAGTVFDPDTGAFGRMPANGPPFFTDDQIKSISDWIDRNCPE